MLSILPVNRLSRQITVWPRCKSASQRWDPMKPAPPATRTVGERGDGVVRGRTGLGAAFRFWRRAWGARGGGAGVFGRAGRTAGGGGGRHARRGGRGRGRAGRGRGG